MPIEREQDPVQVGLVGNVLGAALVDFCNRMHLAPNLVASGADIKLLVRARLLGLPAPAESILSRGWRSEHVLPHLQALLDGAAQHCHCRCTVRDAIHLPGHPGEPAIVSDAVFQRCINPGCGGTAAVDDMAFACATCGGLLDVAYDWERLQPPQALAEFEAKWADRANPLSFSGVWRFRELLPFAPPEAVLTIGEGQTILQKADAVAQYVGMDAGRLYLQYEGMNPSGSFKDNGMTAAFTHARMVGASRAACASTGNTSASLAVFCSATGLMRAIIFIGSGKISYGKLAQALDHGALTVQIAGDFDDAMQRVQQVSRRLGIYLVNSLNPFRLEGQKTIMYRILEALRWEVPDWIVVPGGNLGNVSAFGKAFIELMELGLIQPAAAAGRHQRRRRQHVLPALRAARHALAGRAARPCDRGRLLPRPRGREGAGVDDCQRHRD